MSSKVVDASVFYDRNNSQGIFCYNYGRSGNVLGLRAELRNHNEDQPSGHDGFYAIHAW